MTREHTFSAEGESAFDDIKTMLGGFSPPADINRVEVTFSYADEESDEAALTATAPGTEGNGRIKMNRGTKGHDVLSLLVEERGYLTNAEIEERLDLDNPVGSTTSRLQRQKGVLSSRRSPDNNSRYQYAANADGERLIERIGEYDG